MKDLKEGELKKEVASMECMLGVLWSILQIHFHLIVTIALPGRKETTQTGKEETNKDITYKYMWQGLGKRKSAVSWG